MGAHGLPTTQPATESVWAARARMAEHAVRTRHVRQPYGIPGTALGLIAWPPSVRHRIAHDPWNYWWQAHLLDCLVDAQRRAPIPHRASVIRSLVRGIRLRNFGNWLNWNYDDIAWLGLALQRAGIATDGITLIAERLRSALTDHAGGGLWWRRGDNFKNVPANGPAAIFFARLAAQRMHAIDGARDRDARADLQRAMSIVDWIEEHLVDLTSWLIYDGLRVNDDGSIGEIETAIYTYCQGVYIGACVELAKCNGPRWWPAAARTIAAVARELTVRTDIGPVLVGHGGGDGGLFTGILVRYLAQAALAMPGERSGALAARLVFASAESAWDNRAMVVDGPLFGGDWTRQATGEGHERDLSVQLSGWMTMEAAALLDSSGLTFTGAHAADRHAS